MIEGGDSGITGRQADELVDRIVDGVRREMRPELANYVRREKCDERVHTPVAELIANFDRRYASKLSERITYGAVAIITSAVVIALVALVVT